MSSLAMSSTLARAMRSGRGARRCSCGNGAGAVILTNSDPGVSLRGPLMRRMAEGTPVDSILTYCHYNLINTDMDGVLTNFAREHGIGLINASGLCMGLLTQHGP